MYLNMPPSRSPQTTAPTLRPLGPSFRAIGRHQQLTDPKMDRLGEVEANDRVLDPSLAPDAVGIEVQGHADVMEDLTVGVQLTVGGVELLIVQLLRVDAALHASADA